MAKSKKDKEIQPYAPKDEDTVELETLKEPVENPIGGCKPAQAPVKAVKE